MFIFIYIIQYIWIITSRKPDLPNFLANSEDFKTLENADKNGNTLSNSGKPDSIN